MHFRRMTAFFLVVLLAFSPALAWALDWSSFLSTLTDDELISLQEALANELTVRGLSDSASNENQTTSEPFVWIPKSGSKYHRNSSCSNMKDPTKVLLTEAIRLGYEPCKRCNP